MKRYLKNNRYQLDDHQSENLWYRIRAELTERPVTAQEPSRRRPIRRPAFASAGVLVVAGLLAAWWLGGDRSGVMESSLTGPGAGGSVHYQELGVAPTREIPAPAGEQRAIQLAAKPATAAETRDHGPAPRAPASAIRAPEPVPDEMAVNQTVGGGDMGGISDIVASLQSVDDALSKQAGTVYRAGELYVRGGRSGEVSMNVDSQASPPTSAVTQSLNDLASVAVPSSRDGPAAAMVAPGSVTGGTTPPNGETFELMYFKHAGVNPFVTTGEDPLSTFALDVDNASFTLARSYLDRGVLPPAEAIRVEEFVNALDAGWKSHSKDAFRIGLDGGPSRFGQGYHLLRIGIVGRSIADDHRKPADLVFVIDISGSMNQESRLGAVKRALRLLVDELDEGDRVGIVVYGSRGEVRLAMTDASRRGEILQVIDGLAPNGSTNAAEGLTLGYQLARENRRPDTINRLILCSDGVANTGGETDAEGILQLARRGSDQGITLSTVGFGMGNYNDVLMEKLADQGDGNYAYVDQPAEAERVFRENLTGMLQTIGREAKVQVEFDPRHVERWRLLGYENRDVADRDFRNDAVDAGEVGAGHRVTALYEVKLAADRGGDDDARVGVVRLRWEAPEHDAAHAGQVTEIERPITRDLFDVSEQAGAPQRRAQALAAEFAEILRGSYWAKESRLSDLVPVAGALAGELPADAIVQDLARMIRRAADLEGGDEPVKRLDDDE